MTFSSNFDYSEGNKILKWQSIITYKGKTKFSELAMCVYIRLVSLLNWTS